MAPDGRGSLDVVIEIPRGSRNTYEYDHEACRLRYTAATAKARQSSA